MESNINLETNNVRATELLVKYDDRLTKMAIEEINREIAKKSKIANEIGPSGWTKPIPGRTNKRFLRNTLKNVLSHNKRKSNESDEIRKNVENLIRKGNDSRLKST